MKLKKFPREIEEELTAADLMEFAAHFKIESEKEKQALDEAEAKAKLNAGR